MSRDLGRELRIVRELEGADAVRRQPVCAPDALNRGQADSGGSGHRPAGPVGRLARRFGEGQRDNVLGHVRPERPDAGRPRLVAEQPRATLVPELRVAGRILSDSYRQPPLDLRSRGWHRLIN
jgi:hypothetical protein